MFKRGMDFQATGTVEAAGTAAVKAAAAGVNLTITEIDISIYAFQDTGTVALDDGTTTYFGPFLCKDGNGNHIHLSFKDGFSWGVGKGIYLTVGTANVKARLTVKGFYNY